MVCEVNSSNSKSTATELLSSTKMNMLLYAQRFNSNDMPPKRSATRIHPHIKYKSNQMQTQLVDVLGCLKTLSFLLPNRKSWSQYIIINDGILCKSVHKGMGCKKSKEKYYLPLNTRFRGMLYPRKTQISKLSLRVQGVLKTDS